MLEEHHGIADKYEFTEVSNGKAPVSEKISTPANLSDQGYEQTKRRSFRNALPQILATCAKNLLLLTYGMTLGITTIALPALDAERASRNMSETQRYLRTDSISLSKSEISWFSSINLICVPLGCFISGAITQPLGRKRSMMLLNIPFFMVWLLYYNSTNVTTLYIALVISGLAGGLHEAPVLTYVAEITEPYLRGMLGATAPTTVIVGTVSQLVLGTFYHWRKVVIFNMFFPIVAFVALNFVPESPHWLISKGKFEEAEKSLCWLRGWVQPEEVQQELSILKKFIQTKNSSKKISFKDTIKNYTLRTFVIPHLIVMVTFFTGQFGGMMSLQTNVVKLFERLGTTSVDEYVSTLIFGLVEFAGAVVCVTLVHLTGKRKLLITTTAACAVCLCILAVYDYFHTYQTSITTDHQSFISYFTWVPIVFLNANAFFSHAGIRLIPWVLIGEVYPTDIRATATGASALWFYVFAFMVNKSFGWMMETLNLFGLLGLYATVLCVGSIFFYVFLPETEGLNLYDIERHFARKGNVFQTKIRPHPNDDYEMDEQQAVKPSKNSEGF